MSILDQIAAATRQRVARDMQAGLPAPCAKPRPPFLLEQTLRKPGLSFVCEIKRASPSKGVIAAHFPYLDIAGEYADAGADAISVLTEPYWFKGDDRYLREIADVVVAVVAVALEQLGLRAAPLARDGGGVDDEIRAPERLADVPGLGESVTRVEFASELGGELEHEVEPLVVDVDEGDVATVETFVDAQVANDIGRELGAPRADDDDFHWI